MKVISYLQGVCVRKFSMEEVLPAVGIPYVTIINAIQQRYQFQNMGVSAEAQQRGMQAPAYEAGEFHVGDVVYGIIGLEFGPDGLKATASTTDIAEVFVDDLLGYLTNDFGYRAENIRRPALYSSTLIVEAPENIGSSFGAWSDASAYLAEELRASGKEREVRPFGVRLVVKSDAVGTADASFIFEKRANIEAGINVYFSQAPLRTSAHERVLTRISERLNSH